MRWKSLAAVTALSLIVAPVAAQSTAAPAAAQRVGETTGDSSEIVGTTGWILAAIAVGLIVWGVIELTGDDEDTPNSP